jgi:hypothetical protein
MKTVTAIKCSNQSFLSQYIHMVYPTGSLERFVLGLLQESIPEGRSETNERLISTLPDSVLDGPDNHENDISLSEQDFADNTRYDSDSNFSGPHTNELSSYPICDSTNEDELSDLDLDMDHDEDPPGNRPHGSSLEEVCSFQIMDLLDRLGAPRNGYDRLIALLRKQKKQGFKATKAIGRETLMTALKKRFPSPGVLSRTLDTTKIFFFPFIHMLQDLLDTMKDDIHIIMAPADSNQSSSYSPLSDQHLADDLGDELWDTDWMKRTFNGPHRDFDNTKDVMLPLILYMDKTGTDAYQRYSLEPLIFSLGCIKRDKREDRKAWRHLGFLPSTKKIMDPKEKLHTYHRSLAVLLEGLHAAQQHPPLVRITLSDGAVINRRARLPVMLVMGDQLSQDTLCARMKANSGGASRVHRTCMCSYINVDDSTRSCTTVSADLLSHMSFRATLSDEYLTKLAEGDKVTLSYLKRVRKMNSTFLEHPYGCHAVDNAFAKIDFGGWSAGIYEATIDDFMHSTELGMIKSICSVVYDGLQKKEKETLESLITAKLSNVQSSVRSNYPRWRLNEGFSSQTLMTASERVGSLLSLALSLHFAEVKEVIKIGHARQIKKYLKFSGNSVDSVAKANASQAEELIESDSDQMSDDPGDPSLVYVRESALFFEHHCAQKLSPSDIRHVLIHMQCHGFDLEQIHDLDLFQINKLLSEGYKLFKSSSLKYPEKDIPHFFTNNATHLEIDSDVYTTALSAFPDDIDSFMHRHRFYGVDSVELKHLKLKLATDGNRGAEKNGNTAAVLAHDMRALNMFLEYALCFHSFCKYSTTLPTVLRRNFNNVEAGGRILTKYFERMFYRGDNTVDSRTTKTHVHRRLGQNFKDLLNLMHGCSELGEKLLKTEAKGISRTAQQRGEEVFHSQTCKRIDDRIVVDIFRHHIDQAHSVQSKNPSDTFSRKMPHFLFERNTSTTIWSLDRKKPDASSGCITQTVADCLMSIEPDIEIFEIYNEAILRDGTWVRAFPVYRKEQPWFDFVNIQWETGMFPARCVCFYKTGRNDGYQDLMALVHVVDEKSKGKVAGFSDSPLTCHYYMKYLRGLPALHSVPLASINSGLLAVLHVHTSLLFDRINRGVMVVRPRNEWAYVWLAWNEVLMEANSEEKFRRSKRRPHRRYVSMGDKTIIKTVIQKSDELLA